VIEGLVQEYRAWESGMIKGHEWVELKTLPGQIKANIYIVGMPDYYPAAFQEK
jgi:hypothetical protein